MAEAIGNALPMAIGVALSPIPIAAVLVMLMTARAGINALAFLLGWMLGILIVGIVVLQIPGVQGTPGEPSAVAGWIWIAVGAGLLLLAVHQWRRLAGRVEDPTFLTRLANMGLMHAALAGLLLSAGNVKNVPLIAAGAAEVGAAGLHFGAQAIALLVFTTIGSVTVALPIAGYFAARKKAETLFGHWKDWLLKHRFTVIIVVLAVFGALMIGRGIGMLAK